MTPVLEFAKVVCSKSPQAPKLTYHAAFPQVQICYGRIQLAQIFWEGEARASHIIVRAVRSVGEAHSVIERSHVGDQLNHCDWKVACRHRPEA